MNDSFDYMIYSYFRGSILIFSGFTEVSAVIFTCELFINFSLSRYIIDCGSEPSTPLSLADSFVPILLC